MFNKKLYSLFFLFVLCGLRAENVADSSEFKGAKWRKTAFTHIYNTKHWWDGESFSGPGSSLQSTRTLTLMLPAILKALPVGDDVYGAQVLLDAGCGDFNWMQHVIDGLGLTLYIGTDIVESLVQENQKKYGNDKISFIQLDIVEDDLPGGIDVIMCRDVLAHLSYEDIHKAIANFKKSGAKYLLASSFSVIRHNTLDMITGNFRSVNLQCAPFNFPEPLFSFVELSSEERMIRYGKRICVWRIADLPMQ